MKKEILLIMLAVIMLFPAAQAGDDLTIVGDDKNDLKNNILTQETPIEDFIFVTEYWTPYDTTNWRITDCKTLFMKAYPKNLSEGKTIFVEHVHIDINLQSNVQFFDGWPQDSMDDKLHTGDQIGFWVNETYPYENIFAIEGFSQTLIDGWGFAVLGYGAVDIDEERLSEYTLREQGKVYGNKVQVVYDVLIKDDSESFYHTRSIVDEFIIEVKGKVEKPEVYDVPGFEALITLAAVGLVATILVIKKRKKSKP